MPLNPEFPAIHQTNAALYFDDIKGFGEWSILLSNRARKDLRAAKHADAAMFRIVMNKIKCDRSFTVMTAAYSSQATVLRTVFSQQSHVTDGSQDDTAHIQGNSDRGRPAHST